VGGAFYKGGEKNRSCWGKKIQRGVINSKRVLLWKGGLEEEVVVKTPLFFCRGGVL